MFKLVSGIVGAVAVVGLVIWLISGSSAQSGTDVPDWLHKENLAELSRLEARAADLLLSVPIDLDTDINGAEAKHTRGLAVDGPDEEETSYLAWKGLTSKRPFTRKQILTVQATLDTVRARLDKLAADGTPRAYGDEVKKPLSLAANEIASIDKGVESFEIALSATTKMAERLEDEARLLGRPISASLPEKRAEELTREARADARSEDIAKSERAFLFSPTCKEALVDSGVVPNYRYDSATGKVVVVEAAKSTHVHLEDAHCIAPNGLENPVLYYPAEDWWNWAVNRCENGQVDKGCIFHPSIPRGSLRSTEAMYCFSRLVRYAPHVFLDEREIAYVGSWRSPVCSQKPTRRIDEAMKQRHREAWEALQLARSAP